jgi:heat shock protein HslJ
MLRSRLVAALVLVVVTLGIVSACDIGGAQGSAARPSASDPVTRLVGTWEPIDIPGFVVPAAYPNAFALARVTFEANRHWQGSDGCNRSQGSYTIAVDGVITTTAGPTTKIGCANVPNGRVLKNATHAHIVDGGLVLTDKDDEIIGRYQRVSG